MEEMPEKPPPPAGGLELLGPKPPPPPALGMLELAGAVTGTGTG